MSDNREREAAPGCPHCPDGHRVHQPWCAYVADEVDGDGQPTHIIVRPAGGAHVAESDAVWIRALLNARTTSTPRTVTTREEVEREWGIRTFPKNGASDITIAPSRVVAEDFARVWRWYDPEYRAEVVWRTPASEWEVLDV